MGSSAIETIQWVNRYKFKDSKQYNYFNNIFINDIKFEILKLKKNKIINSFYFFPYHKDNIRLNKASFVDGISCYRNLYEKKFDKYALKNNFKMIAIRVLGGDKNKIVNKKNLKKLLMFNLKNKNVSKIIIGLNNKKQLDNLIKC